VDYLPFVRRSQIIDLGAFLADFDKDFRQLTGKHDTDPFPWQHRVWECFCAGSVPRAVDVPTGLGKTSVLACWLLLWLPPLMQEVSDRIGV